MNVGRIVFGASHPLLTEVPTSSGRFQPVFVDQEAYPVAFRDLRTGKVTACNWQSDHKTTSWIEIDQTRPVETIVVHHDEDDS